MPVALSTSDSRNSTEAGSGENQGCEGGTQDAGHGEDETERDGAGGVKRREGVSWANGKSGMPPGVCLIC